jgi:phosphatidylinositol-3-phosphatase
MSRTCSACAAPLAADQRYCLNCGERVGERRVDPFQNAERGPQSAEPASASASSYPLPTPRIAAVLILAMLGVGSLVGAAAGPNADDSYANQRIAVVAPQAAATTPDSSTSGAALPDDVAEEPAAKPAPEPGAESSAPAEEPSAPASDEGSGGGGGSDPQPTAPAKWAPPEIRHVIVIALSGQDAASIASQDADAPYLTSELPAQGARIASYDADGQSSLSNGIALISGQAPNPDNEANCPVYVSTDADATHGCVFGKDTPTIASQLTDAGRPWRTYVEDIGNGGDGVSPTCRHPVIGSPDPWTAPRPGDAYLTARDPFVYFAGITETPDCPSSVVGLDALASDLADIEIAPSFAYVVPNACHDGRDAPCAEGAPAGLAAADAWLKDLVPRILRSKAYKDAGLLVVTFDGQRSTPAPPDAPPARVGAVAISPFIAPGTVVSRAYDHFALLRSVEDLFGLTPIGHAADPGVRAFGKDVYTQPAG